MDIMKEIQDISFKIGLKGRSGLDINDPQRKYQIIFMPGTFSGLQLVCYMYVGFKLIAPERDIGIDSFQEKIASWIKELEPGIKEQLIAHQMSKLLEDGFRKDLRIILVIDELSTEQKDTMDNVIKAFKLENGQSIQFKGFVVRLEQRINLIDGQTEYGISVQ